VKRFLIAIVAGAAIFNFSTAVASSPTSAEQLRSEFEAALKAKDTNAVLALVNWKGVSDTMKSDTSGQMGDTISQGVAGVKLLPLPADQQLTNEMDGVRYFPNVHVLGLINVESAEKGNGSQIPYGESNGGFYIAGVVQETFDTHAKKSVSLGVAVMGLFPQDSPGILTCSYVYDTGGKEKTASFQCTNNWSEAFWGDSIKSCKVTKISGLGSFRLLINENGSKIFDSGMVKTNNSIFYEQKK
jgi:hypothetical protein